MWLLHFLPDSYLQHVINLVCLGGVVLIISGFVVSMFHPWFYRWRTPLQIIGTVVLVAGIYFKGGYGVEMEWRDRVHALEEQLKVTEAKSKEVNTKIETRVVEKVKVVKQNVEVIKKEIQIQREEIDKECKLTPKAKEIHNKATISNIDGAINIHE